MKKFHLGNIYSVQQMYNVSVIKKFRLFCLVHLNQKMITSCLVCISDIFTFALLHLLQNHWESFWYKPWKIIFYVYRYTLSLFLEKDTTKDYKSFFLLYKHVKKKQSIVVKWFVKNFGYIVRFMWYASLSKIVWLVFSWECCTQMRFETSLNADEGL